MSDLNEPRGRGARPFYLDRALTPAERQRIRRQRAKGQLPKVERLYTQTEVDELLRKQRDDLARL